VAVEKLALSIANRLLDAPLNVVVPSGTKLAVTVEPAHW
jgi:hypothetical protein